MIEVRLIAVGVVTPGQTDQTTAAAIQAGRHLEGIGVVAQVPAGIGPPQGTALQPG